MSAGQDSLDELRAALRADVAGVAVALLGERNKAVSSKRTWRWGAKGSLAIEITGPKRGFWYTHEGGQGADLLGLIQHANGCRFPAALEWAYRFTGLGPADNDDGPTQRRRQAPPPPENDDADELVADRARRIAFAQQIATESVPIAGTEAERYLKQGRGIPMPAVGWPSAIRWHPGHRALVAVATLVSGGVQAVQRVHLNERGEKIDAEEQKRRRLPAVKVTNGVTDAAVVRLPGAAFGPLVIAEGPETGLSVYTATNHETWIALGSVARVQPPIGRKVVVATDDNPAAHDAKRGQAARALRKAIQTWRRAGVDVVIASPWPVRRRDGSDFNDVILEHGPEAVAARIRATLNPARTSIARVSVDEARRRVAEAVGAFFERVDAASGAYVEADPKADEQIVRAREGHQLDPDVWHEPFNTSEPAPDVFAYGIRCDVGTGKSHEARHRIAETLIAMRERGDDRSIVLAVPMHALSDEQAERFRELQIVQDAGLRAAVWRGRAAEDPDNAGEPMCGNLDAVREAQAVGLSAQNSCCRRRLKQPDGSRVTVTCPLFQGCAYQAQTKVQADLWIVASDLLWHEKPNAIGDVAAVIVDEGAWRKGLLGAEGRHVTLSIDAINEDLAISGMLGEQLEGRLRDLRRQLHKAVHALPDGPVQRDALLGTVYPFVPTTLTADSAAEALKLEYARKVEPLHPGQSKEERKAALAQAEGNKTIARFAMLWNALRVMLSPGAPAASGWLSIATEPTASGPVRVLHLKGRRDIAEGWKAPTLLLDALLPIDLVRPFWPDIELIADVKAEMPHQHVKQVVDRAFALSMLAPLDEEAATNNPEEAQRRTNRLHDLRAILVREARRYAPGRVLVVLQKRIKEALSDLGSLPLNMELAHHNNVAGRDEWRDVAALIVVGRTLPSPGAVRRIAEALTGQAGTDAADWYQRADAVREMVDGSSIQAEADRHPDTLVESIRWQSCEGELVQIVGRARGVNRTEADPVDVLVLTDVPLPIPLAGTLNAVELTPTMADRMMAAGGVVLENARHVFAAFPFLWASHEAVRQAFQKERSVSSSYIRSNIGKTHTPRVTYQVSGAGQKSAGGWFDTTLCPDPETFLRDRVGELAWCRVEGDEHPKPEPLSKPKRKAADAGDDGASEPPVSPEPASEIHVADAEKSGPLVYDVPWLHADAPAFQADDGSVVVPSCPYCGERHRHRGFGHRLAHCAEPGGRGYVLRPVPPGSGAGWPLGP